jgi:hypothetical protein
MVNFLNSSIKIQQFEFLSNFCVCVVNEFVLVFEY